MVESWIPDASALTAFRTSPELFRLKFRKHLKAPKGLQNAADAGSALHVALDLWFRSSHSNLPLALSGLRTAWGTDDPTAKRSLGQFESIMERYAKQYPREHDNFIVVMNETYTEGTISVEGIPDFSYCAILDRKIELADGSMYAFDSKSTGSYLSESYFRLLRQSDQLIGQVALERANGRRCDGFFVDAIFTGGASRTTSQFERHGPVLVPDWRVERWAQDVSWTLRQIRDLEEVRGLDKPWPTYHNWAFGKPTEFFEFCETAPELHDELMRAYEVEPWKPETVAQARQELKLLAKLVQ